MTTDLPAQKAAAIDFMRKVAAGNVAEAYSGAVVSVPASSIARIRSI